MKESRISASRVLLVCLTLILATWPAFADQPRAGISHVVLLWLKSPGNMQDRERIIQASRRMQAIPGVVELRLGQVLESERAIVDDSFDIGLVFLFESEADMKAYLAHPVHVDLVKKHISPLTKTIRVYDIRH